MKDSSSLAAAPKLRLFSLIMALTWVLFVSTTQQVANDFWLQAKVGELMVQTHKVPTTLLFPFTEIRSATFHAHEWLASVAFHGLLMLLGEDRLPFVGGLLGGLLFVLTVRLVYRRSQGDLGLAIGWGLVAVCVENYRHVLRPELLSLLLFLLCLDALAQMQERHTRRSMTLFCIGTLLWANVHGSFFLAPLMALVTGLGSQLDRLQGRQVSPQSAKTASYYLLAVLALLCTLLNPVGPELWEFVLHFSQNSLAKQEIVEWLPTFDTRVRPITGVWIGWFAMVVCLGLMWQRRQFLSHGDVLLALLFLALACMAIRFLVYLGFIAAWLVSANRSGRSPAPRHAIMLALGFCCLLWSLVWRYGNVNGLYPFSTPDRDKLTPAMVQVLANPKLQGPVLVSYGLGAELVYRTYPRLQPSIDSRVDSYGDDYYYAHEAMWSNPARMQAFIARYGVRYILASHTDFASLQTHATLDLSQWQVWLMDSKAIFLERIR